MNFLDAIKKTPVIKSDDSSITKFDNKYTVNDNNTLDIEQSFIDYSDDSHIIFWSPIITDFWRNFIEETLLLDYPLLKQHHTGYKDFLKEVVHFIEKNIISEIKSLDIESESDDEIFDDINLLDDMYMNKNYTL